MFSNYRSCIRHTWYMTDLLFFDKIVTRLWTLGRLKQNEPDESTAHWQLKSSRSLSGGSIHLTLVAKWSWSPITTPLCNVNRPSHSEIQKLQKSCSRCIKNTRHIESSYLLQPPKYSLLFVNRFRYINNNITKDRCPIPMDTTVRLGPLKFSLQATIGHHGPSIDSGHYTASINCCKKRHSIAKITKLRSLELLIKLLYCIYCII